MNETEINQLSPDGHQYFSNIHTFIIELVSRCYIFSVAKDSQNVLRRNQYVTD